MKKLDRQRLFQIIGIAGTLICLGLFIREPSFPTPDKIIIFLTFVFMCLGQATEMLRRLLPFVGLLLIYDSFRGLATHLNKHVHFMFMADFDKWLFGGTLPTVTLQRWLWHGSVSWYDFLFYLVYMLHFILPIAGAIIVWKKRDDYYWRYVGSFVLLSFAGFFTYVIYPAAPPWMASDMHLIQHVTHVSSYVWQAMGIHDFPSVYNKIVPNPVAAVPSLHAAYSILFTIFIFKIFGRKWGAVASLYPLLMIFGITYMGEHYVFDVLLGIVYAVATYYIVGWISKRYQKRRKRHETRPHTLKTTG